MRNFLDHIVEIFLGIIFITLILVCTLIDNSLRLEEKDLDRKYILTKERYTTLSAAASGDLEKFANEAGGLDSFRKLEDDKIASLAFRTAFTWDSGRSYTTAREKLIKDFGFSEGDQFLREVMPELITYTVGGYKGSEGDKKSHNFIDDSRANMEYVKFTSYVTDISDKGYEYFALVNVRSENEVGASASTDMVLTYTVKDGKLFNVSGFGPENGF